MAKSSEEHIELQAAPVPEIVLDRLAARSPQLAKLWAIALIRDREPEQIADVGLRELATDGPLLCEQLLRALVSDSELERLVAATGRGGRSPAISLAHLSGATDAPSLVRVLEALRGVLWEELAADLRALPPRRLAAAGDRLAAVCSALLAAALAAFEPVAEPKGQTRGRGEGGEPGAAGAQELPAAEDVDAEVAPALRGRVGVMVVDEIGEPRARHGGAPALWVPERAVIVDERAVSPEAALEGSRGGVQLSPSPSPSPSASASASPSPLDIHIRDERTSTGPAAWIGSIGAALGRFEAEGLPFAVLLVELGELAPPPPDGASASLQRFTDQLERLMLAEASAGGAPAHPSRAPGGALNLQQQGRYWLVVDGVDGTGARRLADRLARGILALTPPPGGWPVRVAIGTAVCPQDGRRAAALAAHADISLHAARASARAGGQPF